MDITLCLIVKNEEQNLDRCLSSFKPLFKDLVVVDTGSTDKTKEIAAKFGAEIFDFVWIDDFSAARNFALSKAKSEWVMMVDADDAMESETVLLLKEKLATLSPNVDGIFVPYRLYNDDKNATLFAYVPRIWKRSLNAKYELMIHEFLNPTKMQLQNFVRLDFPIIHQRGKDDYDGSHKRNLNILYKAVKKDPNERRYYFYLGHDNQYSGNPEEAIKWYVKYSELKNVNAHELNRVLHNLGNCYLKTGKIKEAKEAYLKAINAAPDFIEPYLALGNLYRSAKEYEKAAQYYVSAAGCKPPKTHVFINGAMYKGLAQKKIAELLNELKPK